MSKESEKVKTNLEEKDVLRYLTLINRKLLIQTSGIHWKTEYEKELASIEGEIAYLRVLIDAEHSKREKSVS